MKIVHLDQRITEAFGGATRPEIAEKMDVKYQTLSNWLNGRTDFPLSELVKLANLTDYSLNWILTGKGEKRTAQPQEPQEPGIINEERLIELVRRVVREEMRDRITDEVSRLVPADMMLAPHLGTVDSGDESVPQSRNRKSG